MEYTAVYIRRCYKSKLCAVSCSFTDTVTSGGKLNRKWRTRSCILLIDPRRHFHLVGTLYSNVQEFSDDYVLFSLPHTVFSVVSPNLNPF